ncbi:MAG: MFS family permease [Gammaproteobacteria bacterium]|jgi:MFS family permease
MFICGVMIVFVAGGLRQSLGLFLRPVTLDLEVGRQVFGLVLALQALLFGLAQPVIGLAADRLGAARVIIAGAVLYALGLWLASQAESPWMLNTSLGLIVGLGLAGTTHVVVLGAVGRVVSNERRGIVFGTVIASGSLGMFFLVPVMQEALELVGWRDTLIIAGVAVALLPLLALGLMSDTLQTSGPAQSIREAVHEARSHRGYVLLTAGFFVCGFHVTFIATHLPAFFADSGVSSSVGSFAFAVIGLANVAGAYIFGALGDRYRKKNLLTYIYLGRAVLMGLILVIPVNDSTAVVFGIALGLLWLGTVPLTSGIVAQVFGTRYFSMLFGVVSLSHQLGSFTGAWLGGVIYDITGNYDAMWMLSVLLGLTAAALHWPINDRPLARLEQSAAPA